MPTMEFPQHERLTRVLNIYRSAMRQHIAEGWQERYGDSWLEKLKEALPENNRQELEASEERLLSQRMDGERQLSDEEMRQELLDIPVFLGAVNNRRAIFGELASEDKTRAIHAIYQVRNLWAHPPVKDVSRRLVNQTVNDCAGVLAVFDEEAARAASSEID